MFRKFLSGFLVTAIALGGIQAQDSIFMLLPDGKCPGIKLNGDTELYVGDDLFNLINGGAELYHEYGFVEVLAAEATSGKVPFRFEIYDMGSPESAWGIFSLTATGNEKALSLGDTARRGVGFMQCVRDHYMLYFYFDNADEKNLNKLAKCILSKIPASSGAPYPMEILASIADLGARIKYFRGNLGLSSVYNFHYKDVFGYLEGASAEFDDVKIILLKYRSLTDAQKKFKLAADFFRQSQKYENRVFNKDSFHVLDRKDNQVDGYLLEDFVILLVYPPAYDIDDTRIELIEALR